MEHEDAQDQCSLQGSSSRVQGRSGQGSGEVRRTACDPGAQDRAQGDCSGFQSSVSFFFA